MTPLEGLYGLCLAGVALYLLRERPRILLTPLFLLSMLVLYGIGSYVYFAGADTVPEVRRAVVICLMLMWIGVIGGIELARQTSPLATRSATVVRHWKSLPMIHRGVGDQLLGALGLLVALYLVGVLVAYGKVGQLFSFSALYDSALKASFRHEYGAEGGYLYQTLIASIAPFLSFLLLLTGRAARKRSLVAIGILLSVAVLAGKVGTFEKTPWLIYLLQLMITLQAARSLELGLTRILLSLLVLTGGVILAVEVALPDLGGDIFEWLGYRFFEVNNEVIYQTFYVYPHYLPHTWGMNIGLVHALFGSGELVSAHHQVANFFGAEGATFDAFFIADAWVDFSYGGVLILSILVGWVVKTADLFITNLGKTPLSVALLGSGLYGLFQLLVTSAFTAFLSGGLILIPLLAAASSGLVNDLSRALSASREATWRR
jgi:hypothetical protein